jgi:periplasmic protein CpxP/Spy
MTRKLISLTTAAALSLAGLVYLQAKEPGADGPKHDGPGGPHHMMMENPLEHLSKDLNLTDDQKAKVQPIIDQTKPQLAAIHKEAMEKMNALLESTGAQIRPLLTPEQQVKYDAMKKAHEDMRKAMEEMHDAKSK